MPPHIPVQGYLLFHGLYSPIITLIQFLYAVMEPTLNRACWWLWLHMMAAVKMHLSIVWFKWSLQLFQVLPLYCDKGDWTWVGREKWRAILFKVIAVVRFVRKCNISHLWQKGLFICDSIRWQNGQHATFNLWDCITFIIYMNTLLHQLNTRKVSF